MRWKNSLMALTLTVGYCLTICGAPSWAYMAEKAKLDKAAQDIDAGKIKEGAAEFKQLADQGCPFAQCLVGIMYLNGKGVPKNVHTAISYFLKSAKQGFPSAEEHLGEIYQFGEEGIRKDDKLAANWYRRAAYHGNSKAQLALGKMYMNSHVTNEVDEAKVWLARACQVPGTIADQARAAFATLPGMQELAKTQDNFAFAMANIAVGGTLTRDLGTKDVKPTEMQAPADMPGALEENWDKFADCEKSIAADVTGK